MFKKGDILICVNNRQCTKLVIGWKYEVGEDQHPSENTVAIVDSPMGLPPFGDYWRHTTTQFEYSGVSKVFNTTAGAVIMTDPGYPLVAPIVHKHLSLPYSGTPFPASFDPLDKKLHTNNQGLSSSIGPVEDLGDGKTPPLGTDMSVRCECGIDSVYEDNTGKHSTWCPRAILQPYLRPWSKQ